MLISTLFQRLAEKLLAMLFDVLTTLAQETHRKSYKIGIISKVNLIQNCRVTYQLRIRKILWICT